MIEEVERGAPGSRATLAADVVIVGSGAGGAAVAGALRAAGIDTLIIEAGSATGGVAGRHILNEEPDVDRADAAARDALVVHSGISEEIPGLPGARGIHSVGGMLRYWAGAIPRPDLEEEWDGSIPAQELAVHLSAAAELMWETPANELSRNPDADESQRFLWLLHTMWERFGVPPERGAPTATPMAAKRRTDGVVEYVGADTLLRGSLKTTEGESVVRILSDHIVRAVHVDGGRATGVTAVSSDGEHEVDVRARVVVVAAGAVGTPQLLTASGIESPALGRYLTDHLMLVARVALDPSQAPPRLPGDAPIGVLVPAAPGREFLLSLLELPSHYHSGLAADVDPGMTVDIGAFVGTEPVSTNRLIFDADEKDRFGLPAVRAEVVLTGDDNRRVAEATAAIYAASSDVGLPWHGMTLFLSPLGSSLHLMGTHRLGTDPQTSVVDTESRVWGYENLYLAGNGIIPSRNSANPTLTTVALALRAAAAIVRRHDGRF